MQSRCVMVASPAWFSSAFAICNELTSLAKKPCVEKSTFIARVAPPPCNATKEIDRPIYGLRHLGPQHASRHRGADAVERAPAGDVERSQVVAAESAVGHLVARHGQKGEEL